MFHAKLVGNIVKDARRTNLSLFIIRAIYYILWQLEPLLCFRGEFVPRLYRWPTISFAWLPLMRRWGLLEGLWYFAPFTLPSVGLRWRSRLCLSSISLTNCGFKRRRGRMAPSELRRSGVKSNIYHHVTNTHQLNEATYFSDHSSTMLTLATVSNN